MSLVGTRVLDKYLITVISKTFHILVVLAEDEPL